jgi:type 1 glutamine amidotransferase
MRRSTFTILILAATALIYAPWTPASAREERIRTLLITGDDVKSHPWKEMAEATRDILAGSGKFDVTVVEDMGILSRKDELARFDLMVFMRYNTQKEAGEPSAEAKANLLEFVRGGKGFVPCHLASASFNGWEEWNKLCGRHWVMKVSGHGPRSVFKVRIADRQHPVTRGADDFQQDDELYAKLQGDEPIHVLAEAASEWSGRTEPLLFTREYGKGRVFHNAFGHDGKACRNPPAARLMIRGCEWAATGQVTD